VIQTLEEQDGLRTFHSRNSHSSAGAAGGTGRAEGIAQKQIHLYYSRRRGGVKESIESLIGTASTKTMQPLHNGQNPVQQARMGGSEQTE
jgi:hypothetical protein